MFGELKPRGKTWTEGALDCYKRGCICAGCEIAKVETLKNKKCRMKAYVMAYILNGIKPPEGLRQDIGSY